MRRLFKHARIKLPARWSRLVGEFAYLPRLVVSPVTRRHFREEAAITAAVESDRPLRANGEGLSERVIEIPWISREIATAAPRRVLDTGTAYAPPVYHRLLYRLEAEVDGADLVPFDLPGVRPTVADLRELPFEDDTFDVTVCVSTLEHIGMDNEAYFDSAGEQIDEQGDLRALREMGRVTRPGGHVLVTVPGGPDESYGWLRQYSPDGFTRLAETAGLRAERLDLYAHDPGVGWRKVPPEDLRERTFGAGVAAAAAVICAVLVK